MRRVRVKPCSQSSRQMWLPSGWWRLLPPQVASGPVGPTPTLRHQYLRRASRPRCEPKLRLASGFGQLQPWFWQGTFQPRRGSKPMRLLVDVPPRELERRNACPHASPIRVSFPVNNARSGGVGVNTLGQRLCRDSVDSWGLVVGPSTKAVICHSLPPLAFNSRCVEAKSGKEKVTMCPRFKCR